mgnify:CR=1 FL=1
MNPTSTILKRITESSKQHPDGVFTRLYRYLLREDIYCTAYKHLYANTGAATKGTDDDTADGFSVKYISGIISLLRSLKYCPKPVRRTYIPKHNGKLRPLGIPSFQDKLVQEAIRQILEAIYEPIFSDNSHGFRHGRSCHTAFDRMKYGFNGTKWFIEGDIKGCFDNIDHKVLLGILSEKIKDSKLINLIGAFLKAGYMEEWKYFQTYSGTPQGGILSPILANIYLHELDKKVAEIKKRFDSTEPKRFTDEYAKISHKIDILHSKSKKNPDSPVRKKWIAKEVALKRQRVKIPVYQDNHKRICYVRYADDFLIGVVGSKEDCVAIKAELKEYLAEVLKLELSDEKTKITHSSESARFLGYDVSVRRSQELKRRSDGIKQRVLNGTVMLNVPLQDKIESFLISNGYGIRAANGRIVPIAAKGLRNRSDLEIVSTYHSQIRGICNYYRMASNFAKLDYFVYIMEYSCLKTLASKHRTTMAKARESRRAGKRWGIPYEVKTGTKTLIFLNMTDIRKSRKAKRESPDVVAISVSRRNEIKDRLQNGVCELCGCDNEPVAVHHVKSLKSLKGKSAWEQKMRSIRRKTLVVCETCHNKIHNRTFVNRQ